MPLPTSKYSPRFDGKRLKSFLNVFENLANAALLTDTEKCRMVLEYCTEEVSIMLSCMTEFAGSDWEKAKEQMLFCFGDGTIKEKGSADELRAYSKKYRKKRKIRNLEGYYKYLHGFLKCAGNQVELGGINLAEHDYLFFRGLNSRVRKAIVPKLEAEMGKTPTHKEPAPFKTCADEVRKYFTENNYRRDADSSSSESEESDSSEDSSDSDTDSSDSDSDDDKKKKRKKKSSKKKSKVKGKRAKGKNEVDDLVDRFDKLLAARLTPAPTTSTSQATTYAAQHGQPGRSCYMCAKEEGKDLDHRLGMGHCSFTKKWIADGTIVYSPQGRLTYADGSELPNGRGVPGGMSTLIQQKIDQIKGKARDAPPHMSCSAIEAISQAKTQDQSAAPPSALKKVRFDYKHSSNGEPEGGTTHKSPPPVQVRQPAEPTQFTKDKTKASENTRSEPPKVNTEQGWREREAQKKQARRTNPSDSVDIQDMVSADQVMEKTLNTMLTIPLKTLIAMSPEMQKRFATMTKTRREVHATVAEVSDGEDADDDIDNATEEISTVGAASVTIRDEEHLAEVIDSYSAALAIGRRRFMAMACGLVQGKFGTELVTYLIDSGSELNLIAQRVYEQAGVELDGDGSRWTLRGIHGAPVSLVGCCRDAPVEVNGARFDHHFFVHPGELGRHDGILGQPWLQWFSSRLEWRRGERAAAHSHSRTVGPSQRGQTGSLGGRSEGFLSGGASTEPTPLYAGQASLEIPQLGRSLSALIGDRKFLDSGNVHVLAQLNPPHTFDSLLRSVSFSSPDHPQPVRSPWTDRALGQQGASANAARRYKPVARKVRPVPTYMPNPSAQKLVPIEVPTPPPLSTNPAPRSQFTSTQRLTQERLDAILKTVPDGFLTEAELDLMVHVLDVNQQALAWTEEERGTFSSKYFPDYEIPVIEHVPWTRPPIKVPKALEDKVRAVVQDQIDAGNYEHSTASYRAASFPVLKKSGEPRMVINLEDLNAVTIRDSALPPRADDFAESFVGHQVYAILDLFSGYNGIRLHEGSRDLTTFHSVCGALRNATMPQGFTNAMQCFMRWILHVLGPMYPVLADAFVDDTGVKGPTSRYNDEPIEGNPNIRRFIYEFATTLNTLFHRFREAGVTASGAKLILATPKVQIVGSVVSAKGWEPEHGLVNKVLKWPYCESVSEVRGFLGTAGVGRRWIRNFSLIAKPLSALCRTTDAPFTFGDVERRAMDELKTMITRAPVLRKVNYPLAATITRAPRVSDHGLVVLAVDSSIHGAGWVLYQYHETDKHPAMLGSCTFNAIESRYSQPKAELYGVFRAIKESRHRVWGVHFRLDVDASYLKQMIHEPDLPNAPMTRWVTYIQLFDFELNHVPAAKHKAEDGLSRRPHADDDSSESDGEAELDRHIGSVKSRPGPSFNAFTLAMAEQHRSTTMKAQIGFDYEISTGGIAQVATVVTMGEFESHKANRIAEWVHLIGSAVMAGNARPHNANIVDFIYPRWYTYHQRLYPAIPQCRPNWDSSQNNPQTGREYWAPIEEPGNMSPFHPSLLRNEDDATYIGNEFMVRSHAREQEAEFLVGDEVVTLTYTEYRPMYIISELTTPDQLDAIQDHVDKANRRHGLHWQAGSTTWDARPEETRMRYAYMPPPTGMHDIRCASHEHKGADTSSTQLFEEIKRYISDGTLPERCVLDRNELKNLKRRAQGFIVHDGRLWKTSKRDVPRLVVLDEGRRRELIAEAHNDCGHRGRDPTYTKLADRYYWPSMYDEIAFFVRSCNSCQYRSRTRTITPLSITLAPSILRRWVFDTVYMPKGEHGEKYLLHGSDALGKWVEAWAVRKNNSRTWADFLWMIICRFGCLPIVGCDGGPEFKGAVRILLEEHGVAIILSTPYHPQGNGIAERDGQTLMRVLLRSSGDKPQRWPRHLGAALLAIRTTVSRATGFTPYFLLYGKHCLFPFDLTDRTWYRLAWDEVKTTEDLLAIRVQQIERRDKVLGEATEHLRQSRQRAIDDFMRKYARQIELGDYAPGTWVVVHETWLDAQHGNKGALRWAGPYIIHERYPSGSYCIRELDGTVLKEHVAASRLRLFFYRADHQTMSTVLALDPADDPRLEDVPHYMWRTSCGTLGLLKQNAAELPEGVWDVIDTQRWDMAGAYEMTNAVEMLALVDQYYTPWC
ncbi:hypothetical protein EVJ58_g9929 [Rhodofomes roseus]|uniref:RNA-directed DNA polymerase n=1 Tax=Rhodofomes roseus TaxID=34475 RepID=A0A4Y9XVN0_9APHY|nr:hypothetical protein EVJ58_g9929 [Rhodofomes roseus]